MGAEKEAWLEMHHLEFVHLQYHEEMPSTVPLLSALTTTKTRKLYNRDGTSGIP